MVRRDKDGGNTFMDFVWGAIILAGVLILLLEFV